MERASRIKQIRIYVGKCFRLFIYEHGWKNFISTAIISLIVCLVISRDKMFVDYSETRSGLFVMVCACVWIGIFNSIQAICKERDIIKREHRSGLHVSSYVLSHVIFDAVLCFAESLIVTAFFCIFCHKNLPSSGVMLPAVLELWIFFLLILYSSDAMAMMISSIVKTPNTAMTVMPFVLILQLVCSGFLFELKGVLGKISYLTIAKWGVNALCITANVNSYAADNPLVSAAIAKNADIYEFTVGNSLMNCGILVGFIVLYVILSIIALEFIDKDKR